MHVLSYTQKCEKMEPLNECNIAMLDEFFLNLMVFHSVPNQLLLQEFESIQLNLHN